MPTLLLISKILSFQLLLNHNPDREQELGELLEKSQQPFFKLKVEPNNQTAEIDVFNSTEASSSSVI